MEKSEIMFTTADGDGVLGKMFVYTLPSVLVPFPELREICMSLGMDCGRIQKPSAADAFRSATGDIRERIEDGTNIFRLYFRDNKREGVIVRKELIKESLDVESNRYRKLASVWYDRDADVFGYGDLEPDSQVDPESYCLQAEQLFSKYRECANSSHVNTIVEHVLESLNATKSSFHGRFYFVPRDGMAQLELLEDFLDAVNRQNLQTKSAACNSFFVVNDEKQRQKMAEDFIAVTQEEIEQYIQRIQELLNKNTQSGAIMSRWLSKAEDLARKKEYYEELLQRRMDGLSQGFASLRFYSSELELRLRGYTKAA